ncbi:hypothetical protein C2845_PM05G28050 [Panicum miliaceum]|uniref:Uncharacterized protein n=1 Tax=Panicum miliaceum TaxID=4540 RepID=A0A3L6T1V1_PANMI|nr:hypothetical protein C2845_PM05G28050 [Panicum miliaceum]
MEGGGFNLFSQETLSAGGNVWPSQPSATGPTHAPALRAGLDSLGLNSQEPQGEEFPHLHDYGVYLRGDDEEGAGRGRGSGLLPPPAPRSLGVPNQRAGGGADWATRGALRARQLNFGASSSAGGGRGGHDDAMPSWPAHGGGNSGVFIGGSSSGVFVGGSSSGVGCDGGRGAPTLPRGHRAAVGSAPTRPTVAAPADVEAVVGVQRGVPALRKQPAATTPTLMKKLKNQIGILKSIYSFWGYMQSHTGLGRKPDGSIDADSDYWHPYLEGKPYLKKVLKSPPANLDQLEEMFSGNTVDGSTAFVPGDDYGTILSSEFLQAPSLSLFPNLELSGNLAYNMNNLGSLTELDMSQNSLGGGNQIQYNLPTVNNVIYGE